MQFKTKRYRNRTNIKMSILWSFMALLLLPSMTSGQTTSMTYSISRVEPGVQACVGVPVELRISANVSGGDLVAAEFKIDASTSATLLSRTTDPPISPPGSALTYISQTAQTPDFDNDLPQALDVGVSAHEVLMDMGQTGLPPGPSVEIEIIEIVPAAPGLLTISLSQVGAALATTYPAGELVLNVSVNPSAGSVVLDVQSDCDSDGDGIPDAIDSCPFDANSRPNLETDPTPITGTKMQEDCECCEQLYGQVPCMP